METTSPPSSSLSPIHQEISSSDGFPIQQSLLLSESLKGLRNMRSQLYSAAAYFELSYINDDQKEILVTSLKDYAVKAILNAVDHLGSVSCKVPFGRLPFTYHARSVGAPRLTIVLPFLLQRLRTWQASIDHEGLSQQSLSLRPPKYHERYILPGEFMDEGFHPPEDNHKLQQHQTAIGRSTSPIRNVPSRSTSPSTREHSSSPSRSRRSTSPSPQAEKISSEEKRSTSPLGASNPLARTRSAANRPTIPKSSKQSHLESQNSLPKSLRAERKETPNKKRGFLKSLLKRNRSWMDDSLYSYLDEY
ncbi:probable protein ABIL3 isoform X2 [Musa acuminata AAA Group]|uniref:probable protein ABIL3 isoform X2 n=1 Tax=Musa acuminata AAA Group TaxID=214697 RepID=UPI0031D3E8C3